MRVVLIGATDTALRIAQSLVKDNHEVVIVEIDREKIEVFSEKVDCSFLHGDGSKPDILREAEPEQTHVLFCLTDSDQTNIIASLVGRSLGFDRVVTSIRDPAFEPICLELGLKDTIIPSRTIARYLTDMVTREDAADPATVVKDEARFFTFVARREEEGPAGELALPKEANVVCFYREGRFHLTENDTILREGDEVLLLTHRRNLEALRERFHAEPAEA